MQKFGLVLIVGLIVTMAPQAQTPNLVLPVTDSYQDFVALVKKGLLAGPNAWENLDPFNRLMAANRETAVLMLLMAFKATSPQDHYAVGAPFQNPLTIAYQAKKYDLVKKMVNFDRELISLFDYGWQSIGLEPVAVAVSQDDLVWTKFFLDNGATINTTHVVGSKSGPPWPTNLYTISRSAAMDRLLLTYHIKTIYQLPSPTAGTCNDDRVRLRANPTTEATILTTINSGSPVTVLASTYKVFRVGDETRPWVMVTVNETTGWIFQKYLTCPFFDNP